MRRRVESMVCAAAAFEGDLGMQWTFVKRILEVRGGQWVRVCWPLAAMFFYKLGFAQTLEPAALAPIKFYLSDVVTHDDNLYRVPDNYVIPLDSLGADARREETINRVSAGMEGSWLAGRQKFDLSLRADDNRFTYNKLLNYVSGNGLFAWDWLVTSAWSGRLGAQYSRSLAGFTNNRLLTKDVLTTHAYFAEANIAVGPSWTVRLGAQQAQTSHGSEARAIDDFHSTTGNAGIEYETKAADVIGLDYRYTQSKFDENPLLLSGVVGRDYDETTASLRFKYAFTVKTRLEGNAGYLQRHYVDSVSQNFSGDVWHLSLAWQPSTKTQLSANAWRELRAYVDAESDYFVATGGGIEPSWMPTEKLKLSLRYSDEDQRYLGSAVMDASTIGRSDQVRTSQFNLVYAPIALLQINLSYSHEQRHSNRDLLSYADNLAALGLRLSF